MPPENVSPAHADAEMGHVAGLAKDVLAALQTRAARAAPAAPRGPDVVSGLFDTVANDDETFCPRQAVLRSLDAGVSAEDLADHVIPQAARRLGACWDSSELSFARVTIASAWLQAMLGCLSQMHNRLEAGAGPTPGILVLSMRGDQHTLAWKLLTLQLRRLGYSAHAAPDVTGQQAAHIVGQASYDLVLVSASCRATLDGVGEMVTALNARKWHVPPVVVGGILLDTLPPDVRAAGVVALTNSLDEALSHRRRRPAPAAPLPR